MAAAAAATRRAPWSQKRRTVEVKVGGANGCKPGTGSFERLGSEPGTSEDVRVSTMQKPAREPRIFVEG